MPFFHFLFRHIWLLLLGFLIGGTIGAFSADVITPQKSTTTVFSVIAASSIDPYSSGQASADFVEMVAGWYRNPAFLQSIEKTARVSGSVSARKQERQNLLIETQAIEKEDSKALAEAAIQETQAQIDQLNTASMTDFSLLNQGMSTSTRYQNPAFSAAVGAFGGVALILFLVILWEVLCGVVSSQSQATEILECEVLERLCKNWAQKSDLSAIATAIANEEAPVILAGVGVDIGTLSVAIAQRASLFGDVLYLIDGDLEHRNLQEVLGLTNRIKSIRGHTDLLPESEVTYLLQNTLLPNLKFIAAGSGNGMIVEVLEKTAERGGVLIHTQLPENMEMLRYTDAMLYLVIRIGKTKIEDLRKIAAVWEGGIRLIVIG